MARKCEMLLLTLALTFHSQVHSGNIYSGHKVLPHKRPYMVLLEIHLINDGISFCGGFILNEDFVMTAAHCQAESYKVLVGFHRFSENSVHVPVEKAFPHEHFNKTDCRNDIMLLKLSTKVNFTQNVSFIGLASGDDDFLPTSCSISGWGPTNREKQLMSRTLMEASVTLVDSKDCPKAKSYCSKGEVGPSRGDSGGPLVCEDGKAYGVVSSSTKTLSGQHIYSYAKIPDYRDWIDLTMKNHGKA